MKAHFLTIVFFFCIVQIFYSQEEDGVVALALPIRNSLKFNRYIDNPTFSFVREQNKYISIYNKREWVQFEDAPQTYLASYAGRFRENIGIGIGAFQQNYGVLTTFGGVLNFAYNAQLDRDSNLTFGMNVGAYKSGLNSGKVVTNFPDPSLENIPSNFLLTASPGINYGTAFLDFGVAVNNLLLYNINTSEMIEDNPKQGIQGHIMYTGYMSSNGFFDESRFSALVRSEFKKDNTVISGNLLLMVPKGIWGQIGYNSLYGASAGLGLNITQNIAIEYSFEKALGDLTDFGPSHEITLAYKFNNNENYDYSREDDVSGLISTEKKRKPASRISKIESDANRKLAAEAKIEAEAKAKREAEAKEEEAKAKLAAEIKAKEEAKAKADAEASRKDAEAKLQAEQQEQQKIEAERIAKEVAEAKAKIAAENKAKAETEAARLAAEAKAKAEATAKAEQEAARIAAEEKAKEDARIAAEAKAIEDARVAAEARAIEDARIAAELQAKQDAEAQAIEEARLAEETRIAAENKAMQETEKEAARLAAEVTAKAEQESQEEARLANEAKAAETARLEAEAQAKQEQEVKANQNPVETATDDLAVTMNEIAKQTDDSENQQDELLKRFSDAVASKNQDLKDLKQENDLSDQGIYTEPKPFKSVTEENNAIEALKSDIDQLIESRNQRIKDLEELYEERVKIATMQNDTVNLYYQKKIKKLKAEQLTAIQTKARLTSTLEDIKEATEFERKRRIKRAAYDNEQDRYQQDRAALSIIKQNTTRSNIPLKEQDFDFGDEQSDNIQILKNIKNTENGYYLVIAVHNEVEKRDDFVTKVVASGRTDVDFFYDVSTSKYYIYYDKFDSIEAANEALKSKGSRPYNGKLSIVKIEN